MSKVSMKNRYQRRPDAEPAAGDVTKQRRCLMCRTDFTSTWSGERICGKCRSKAAWREGHGSTSGGRAV